MARFRGPLTPILVNIDGADLPVVDAQTNVTLNGVDFNSVQGTGILEIANSQDRAAASVAVTQTITIWGSNLIEFTADLTGLTSSALYAFVTNSDGQRSLGLDISSGGALQYAATILDFTNTADLDTLDIDLVSGNYDPMSYSFWVRVDASAAGQLDFIAKRDEAGSPTDGWRISFLTSGVIRFTLNTTSFTGTIEGNTDIVTDGAWHHVAITLPGVGTGTAFTGGVRIYIDGNLETHTTSGAPTGTAFNTEGLRIGHEAATWDLRIDMFRIFSDVLTSGDVAVEYNNGVGVSTTTNDNLLVEYRMDETSGTTVTDSGDALNGTNEANVTRVGGIVPL